MLDKNYKIEQAFLAELPVRFRAGASAMLGIEPLSHILAWQQPGLVDRYFKDKPPQAEEKTLVRSRLILSKITYFNPRTLDRPSMELLLDLARQMLDLPKATPEEIAKYTAHAYPVFSAWALNVNKYMNQSKSALSGMIKDTPDKDVDWCR